MATKGGVLIYVKEGITLEKIETYTNQKNLNPTLSRSLMKKKKTLSLELHTDICV